MNCCGLLDALAVPACVFISLRAYVSVCAVVVMESDIYVMQCVGWRLELTTLLFGVGFCAYTCLVNAARCLCWDAFVSVCVLGCAVSC